MEFTYIVEYRHWDEIKTVQFIVDDLADLFKDVNDWMRRNAIYEDAIISIELD